MSNHAKPLMPVSLVDISVSEKEEAQKKAQRMVVMMPIITLCIGWGIAELIYHLTGAKVSYDGKIATLASNDLHWLYFSAVILCRLNMVINFTPMIFKAAVVRGNSGNLRANMYVYRVSAANETAESSAENGTSAMGPVVLEEMGDAGKYNRGNRSLHHYIENLPPFLLGLPLAAFVFPAAVFVLTCTFAVGRILHQVGYSKGYGGHGAGFGLALLSTCVLEGLLLTAALSAAGARV